MHIGSTISHYKIVEKLGEGGMGVVYKAQDTTLDRPVALKFLADHLLNDAEAKERFLREAKAAAALHHPNVCPVHQIAEAEGKTFLAMAFLEGESLEDRIAKGPLSIKDALDIARQVAEGLDAAHEKGIVHRDIKPANIMVDAKGHATIMDFGLARLTEASRLTKFDTAMGTVAYMSPEQAQGMQVDHRSDVWALGCVLYEMVAGQRPFQGMYDQALLYEIVNEEVAPLTSIRAGVPMELELLTAKCLAKDREDRYQYSKEIAVDLRTLTEKLKSRRSTILHPGQMTGAASPAGRTLNPVVSAPAKSSLVWQVLAAVLGMIAIAFAIGYFRMPVPVAERVLRLTVPLPADDQVGFVKLSPDGRRLALGIFRGSDGGRIYLRDLDSDDLQPLADTVGARSPFWSPDGRRIGFFADGQLKVISAAGGPAEILCETPGREGGGSWSLDGVILFASQIAGFRRVDAQSGGSCTVVGAESTDSSAGAAEFPAFLPDGVHFFYTRVRSGDEASEETGVYLATLDEPSGRRVLPDVSEVLYTPPARAGSLSHLLFLRESTLMAQPFDEAKLQPIGDPFAVVSDVSQSASNGLGASASGEGTLVYLSGSFSRELQLTWFDRTGVKLGQVGGISGAPALTLSPDGNSAVRGRTLFDLVRGSESLLPAAGGVWSADSRRLWFGYVGPEGPGIYQKDLRTGEIALVQAADRPRRRVFSDWSRDGQFLLYTEVHPETDGDIWLIPVESGKPNGQPVQVLGSEALESQGQISPDGRWLAYVSDETGRYEVYIRSFPQTSETLRVSIDGGREPRWRADGRELYFRSLGASNLLELPLTAVSVETDGSGGLRVGVPEELFIFRAHPIVPQGNSWAYSPNPSGQRFLANVLLDDSDPTLHVITNWQAAVTQSER